MRVTIHLLCRRSIEESLWRIVSHPLPFSSPRFCSGSAACPWPHTRHPCHLAELAHYTVVTELLTGLETHRFSTEDGCNILDPAGDELDRKESQVGSWLFALGAVTFGNSPGRGASRHSSEVGGLKERWLSTIRARSRKTRSVLESSGGRR